MPKLSPQKRKILDLHKDGEWHCSTEVEFIRDQRKRVSEMNHDSLMRTGDILFESLPCDGSPKSCGGNHNSGVHMRRLKIKPKKQIVEYTPQGTVIVKYV